VLPSTGYLLVPVAHDGDLPSVYSAYRRCRRGGGVPHRQERIALVTEVEVRQGGGPWAPAVHAIVARPQRKEGSRVPAGRTGLPGIHMPSSLGQTAVEHAALHTETGVALRPAL
jgi:hypothetical protein